MHVSATAETIQDFDEDVSSVSSVSDWSTSCDTRSVASTHIREGLLLEKPPSTS